MIFNNKQSHEQLISKEWLVTNGLGGYASSTIIGENTRRYHGLLVAAFNPPTQRNVLVSKIEEQLQVNGTNYWLSTNSFPSVTHPEGYKWLESFERKPLPESVFASNTFRLAKTVFMVYKKNTTIVAYDNIGFKPVTLTLNPLYVFRDYHSLFRESGYFDFYTEATENQLKIFPHYGAAPFFVHFTKGQFEAQSSWYNNFEYDQERERGLDFQEDAKSIGTITLDLAVGEKAYLVFSTEEIPTDVNPDILKIQEINRLHALSFDVKDEFLGDLLVSGDQFLVHRQSTDSSTLIAGYHWFTDWGRDTMIAMRGLTIATSKQEISKSILRTFLKYLDQGMLPNRFPDQGEAPEYNTFDATLWLFVVLYEYYEKFKDAAFIAEVLPTLREILEFHIQGTRYNIHTTPEGLLFGGEGLAQLTWMDAKVGDYVVTPRQGCPVEINALWYNALQIYTYFAKTLHLSVDKYATLATQVKSAFQTFFINDKGYLNDVVIPNEYEDDSIRPNQLYAISLPFDLLDKEQCRSVLQFVEESLYTPYGLRSLNMFSQSFKGIYNGNQWQRDTAYHQGTVWAFLWGEYALAYLKVHDYAPAAQQEVREKMETLKRHFYESDCLHGISEIFDGLNPQAGKGCIQQAWSVGMLIKVLIELQAKS